MGLAVREYRPFFRQEERLHSEHLRNPADGWSKAPQYGSLIEFDDLERVVHRLPGKGGRLVSQHLTGLESDPEKLANGKRIIQYVQQHEGLAEKLASVRDLGHKRGRELYISFRSQISRLRNGFRDAEDLDPQFANIETILDEADAFCDGIDEQCKLEMELSGTVRAKVRVWVYDEKLRGSVKQMSFTYAASESTTGDSSSSSASYSRRTRSGRSERQYPILGATMARTELEDGIAWKAIDLLWRKSRVRLTEDDEISVEVNFRARQTGLGRFKTTSTYRLTHNDQTHEHHVETYSSQSLPFMHALNAAEVLLIEKHLEKVYSFASQYYKMFEDFRNIGSLALAASELESRGATWNEYVDDGRIILPKMQSPLLVLREKKSVPNDVVFDGNSMVVATGSNQNGKTHFFVTAAQTLIMAQAYLPTFGDPGIITPRDSIVVNDTEYKGSARSGESGWSVESRELSNLLGWISPRSFTIFDEVGQRSNPFEVMGILKEIMVANEDGIPPITELDGPIFGFTTHHLDLAQDLATYEYVSPIAFEHRTGRHKFRGFYDRVAKTSNALPVAEQNGLDLQTRRTHAKGWRKMGIVRK